MNLQEILSNLHTKLGSDRKIAEELGISQPTAYRLRKGLTSTSFDTGLKIIELGRKHAMQDDQAVA